MKNQDVAGLKQVLKLKQQRLEVEQSRLANQLFGLEARETELLIARNDTAVDLKLSDLYDSALRQIEPQVIALRLQNRRLSEEALRLRLASDVLDENAAG